jgi:hypothetical protein
MSEADANVLNNRNKNAIIIAVAIVVLAVIFMFFHDRQQQRILELQRLDTQADIWEEWGLPQQNRQLNNASGKGGEKIL